MIKVDFDSEKVQFAINKIVDFLDGNNESKNMFSDIANIIVEDVSGHFKKQEGSDGSWKPLEPSTLFNRANKLGRPVKELGSAVKKYTGSLIGGAKILQNTGKLKNSIMNSKKSTDDYAQLSTKRPGAVLNNFGGTVHIPELVPKKNKAMRFLKTQNGTTMVEWMFSKRIKAHDVKVPKRDFMFLSKGAKDSISDIVFKYLDKIWGK
jgi:phage gpG-like protein